ncbi:MAG: SanA protein [Acidaminobacter sp.]|uniref:SanA/YdcF family protein n=1 Tax=Acidaminobacter sp. TaxID=1872102 RepID=UPI001385B056|nr:ElyC/SanA/YdcF family protein [Acidaminobacter sp.]MZQ97629.1 SanA protein [Acidaminobacter sp.]
MKTKTKTINFRKSVFPILFILLVIPFVIGGYVTTSMSCGIVSEVEALEALEVGANIQADCILVLGAGIRPDGTPSFMLRDRLDKGIELYEAGVAPKLLLSGDNGQERYDEVNAMKGYVLAQGIPPEDIFLDHAGFSTYDSIYRARAIFEVEEAVVVTQKYHLYRALYISERLGLQAVGVSAEGNHYAGQWGRDVREFLAKNKDFVMCFIKPEPKYLGEVIPITGDGRLSHD